MTDYRSLNHTKWACQYHVVFIPKYRKKAIYQELRRYLGDVLRRLAQRRESEVEDGHLMIDHVHLMWSIPRKYAVADVIGYIQGKSAIHIARNFAGRPRRSPTDFPARRSQRAPPRPRSTPRRGRRRHWIAAAAERPWGTAGPSRPRERSPPGFVPRSSRDRAQHPLCESARRRRWRPVGRKPPRC